MTRISIFVLVYTKSQFLICTIHNHSRETNVCMREIGCCQLGVYIPLWEFSEFPWQEDHLNKQTNKQINIAWPLFLCSSYLNDYYTCMLGSSQRWLLYSPILTGKPAGSCNVIKSLSLAKWALLMAIKSIMGNTWQQEDNEHICKPLNSQVL